MEDERAAGPTSIAGTADDAFVRRLLDAALARSGMESAWLSEHTGSEQRFHYVQGARASGPVEGTSALLEGSYCARVLDGRLPQVVPDSATNPYAAELPATTRYGIGSYIGVPVCVDDGEVFGMLACVSTGAEPHLDERIVGYLEALGSLIGAELHHHARRRRSAEDRRRIIVGALEAGLEIVYQPIVDLHTAAIVGAEALARFAQPPSDPTSWFRDAADVELGQDLQLAAIAEALRHIDELPDDVYLAVNASPAVILHPRMHELIATVPPERLVIELTEHAAVDDYEELAEVIGRMRANGVRLAIDDAGAGFSSLRHVLLLRPDIIKLDMSITRNVDTDPVRRALAEALVTFAGVIGASIVAEGVETRGELDALLALGASSAQGFFLRRPAVLPLPEHVPRPTPRIVFPPDASPSVGVATSDDCLAGEVASMLDQTLALTDLESAYLTVLDDATGDLVVTHVLNSGDYEVPEGFRMPLEQSLSKVCHDRGIRWTAEAPLDLGDRPTYGVQTYVSVPIEAPDGRFLGALAAASRERRYLDAAAYEQLQAFARRIGEQLSGGSQLEPPTTATLA